MARTNSIKRLPAEIRELIGRLRGNGRTLDEIREKLAELDVDLPRSTLGRHIKQLDVIGEEIRRSRAISEALVAKLGDEPESRTARLNIELMQSMVMKLLVGEDGEAVALTGKEAMFISSSLQKLASAAKTAAESEIKIRKAVAEHLLGKVVEAVAKAEEAGEPGLSSERLAQLKKEFLGIRPGAGK